MKAAIFLVFLGSACVSPLKALTTEQRAEVEHAQFVLRSNGQDADVARVRHALEAAVPAVAPWGGLRQRVTLYVLPEHASLERAVNGGGLTWLRAWGRYDEILLKAPSTWATTDAALTELLVHELTHVAMYQRSAEAGTWLDKGIPVWFREGMAVWTAKQGDRYPGLEDLARWLLEHPERDLFGSGADLVREISDVSYGFGYHAFNFLVRRYHPEAVLRIMQAMHEGLRFDEAFTQGVGLSPAAFRTDFENYTKLRGFRAWARPVGRPPMTLEEYLRQRRERP